MRPPPIVVAATLLAIAGLTGSALATDPTPDVVDAPVAQADHRAIVDRVLKKVPLFDGHNDAPWSLRRRVNGQLHLQDLAHTHDLDPPMHTDIPRMRQGGIGAQFWSVFVPVSLEFHQAVHVTLEQIDLVHRLSVRHPEDLAVAYTADDVLRVFASGRMASLIGIEGGHSIGNSLAVLRRMYDAGARYMTLTHWTATDWADAATADPRHGGLSDFGREVVREMNRLGMMVDLSHVSFDTMRDALDVSEAPIIFSHSGAHAVCQHVRNVPDDVLARMPANGGVVMVDFLEAYVSNEVMAWSDARRAEYQRLQKKHGKKKKKIDAGVARWTQDNPAPKATLGMVADHIDHIRAVAGVDHLGIGSDFDGMRSAPIGLEDASRYPALFEELLRRGYSEEDLCKIAGLNMLRVMRAVEGAAAIAQASRPPSEVLFDPEDNPATPRD